MPLRPGESVLRFAFVVVMVATLGCADPESGQSSPPASPDAASEQPRITLLDLRGHPFDFLGPQNFPVTVALFTRTDCPISNRLAPEIRHLYEVYHPRGVDFFLVYVDPSEPPETIDRHLREYGYPCQGLRDPQHTLVDYCRATTTPEAVVFDKDRSITYLGRINDLYEELGRRRAEATTHDLADAIESTVQGRPVAVPRAKAIGCPIADLRS